jgi:hypothetical protein
MAESQPITIPLDLPRDEACAFAELLKRTSYELGRIRMSIGLPPIARVTNLPDLRMVISQKSQDAISDSQM